MRWKLGSIAIASSPNSSPHTQLHLLSFLLVTTNKSSPNPYKTLPKKTKRNCHHKPIATQLLLNFQALALLPHFSSISQSACSELATAWSAVQSLDSNRDNDLSPNTLLYSIQNYYYSNFVLVGKTCSLPSHKAKGN